MNEESAAPVYFHSRLIRAQNLFGEVREAFWKQEPQVRTVLEGLTCPMIFLVPLFISEGYFSDNTIPRELGFGSPGENGVRMVREAGGQERRYCRAVGTHPRMTDVVLARARSIVLEFPFPRPPLATDTTLLLAGHGTLQDPKSRESIEQQAARLRQKAEYAAVHAMFLEEEPRVKRWPELVTTRNVVVVPFFISEGMHTAEDLPVLLGEPENLVRGRLARRQPGWRNPTEKHGRLVWLSPSVGKDNLVSEIILERVRESS